MGISLLLSNIGKSVGMCIYIINNFWILRSPQLIMQLKPLFLSIVSLLGFKSTHSLITQIDIQPIT